jgi:dipeptidyl-peptidase-3
MTEATKNAANENQKKMCENYTEHFQFGDINVHKESQKNWISDVGPIVETNIGFIETYQDPSGARA